MSIHKIKPKLKKYKKAGLLKARKNSAKQVRFFLPECTYLNSYLKKLENSYSDSLINRRKIKLLSGFYQVNKLNNFIKQTQKKRANNWRFSKPVTLVSLIERRLDLILFRPGFTLSLSQARQLIGHRKVFVNGTVITSPFFLLKKGDVVSFSPKIKFLIITNIAKAAMTRETFVSAFSHLEINLNILKIILIEDNLKTKGSFPSLTSRQDWNLLFSK